MLNKRVLIVFGIIFLSILIIDPLIILTKYYHIKNILYLQILISIFIGLFIIETLIQRNGLSQKYFLRFVNKINNWDRFSLFMVIFSLSYAIIASFLGGIFFSGLPTDPDYSFFYLQSWWVFQSKFNSNNIYINAGLDTINPYHFGLELLTFFLQHIGISLDLIIRFYIFIAFFFSVYFPYYFLEKTNKFNNVELLIGSLTWLAGVDALFYIKTGLLSFYFSAIIAVYSFSELRDFYNLDTIDKLKNNWTLNRAIKIGFLLSFSIILHLYGVIFIGFVVLTVLIQISIGNKINILDFIRFSLKWILIIITIMIIALFSYGIYLISLLNNGIQSNFYTKPPTPMLDIRDNHDLLIYRFIFENMLIIYVVLFIYGIIYLISSKKRLKNYPLLSTTLIFWLLIITATLIIYILQQIMPFNLALTFPYRYLILINITAGFSVAYAIKELLTKKMINTKKYYNSNRLYLTLFLFLLSWPLALNLEYVNKYMNYSNLSPRIISVANWVNDHPLNHNSRILIENDQSTINSTWNGEQITLLPVLTDEYYVSFFSSYFWTGQIEKQGLSMGYCFGRTITDIKREDFLQHLRNLNIKYIIAWNSTTKKYLENMGPEIIKVHSDGIITYYKYLDCPESYAISNNKNIIIIIKEFDYNKFLILVDNASIGDSIQISINNNPSWEVRLNNSKIQYNEESEFINITIPKNGKFIIEGVWNTSIKKKIFLIQTPLTMILIGFYLLEKYLEDKMKNKNNKKKKSTEYKKN